MGKFFPDYGSYDTGNPLLDIVSGRAKKREEEEERDPFDLEDWAQEEPDALPEGEDAAVTPPAPEVRTLQKRELINKERRKKKEAEAKGAAPAEEPEPEPEEGRGAGAGLWTPKTLRGGYKSQHNRRVGTKGWDD